MNVNRQNGLNCFYEKVIICNGNKCNKQNDEAYDSSCRHAARPTRPRAAPQGRWSGREVRRTGQTTCANTIKLKCFDWKYEGFRVCDLPTLFILL